MGILKIEIDLPNFEKELSLDITIKKDGEVIYTASSPNKNEDSKEKETVKVIEGASSNFGEKVTVPKKPSRSIGGNLMNSDLIYE